MNEEYLKGFRKLPDSPVLDKIHLRLERRERSQRVQNYLLRSVLAMLLAFGALFTFSPTVRAQVIDYWWKTIGGVTLRVYNDFPADTYTLNADDHWSLEEAQGRFASPISLPVYVPQGYERTATVMHALDGYVDLVTITWKKDYEIIDLTIQHCHPDLVVDGVKGANCGVGGTRVSVEEITLNGTPAALVYGSSDEGRSNQSAGVSVIWLYDKNTVYMLTFFDEDLSREELVKMAESIP